MTGVPTTSAEIRSAFLAYFESHAHERVPSSSLVPANDPSLTFTNSGMVQFKEALVGTSRPACARATSAQRCVRAGGKHNDLENVGYTLRHHTFFEMLGNFSFGDYFKEDTIRWAWEFVTEHLQLEPDSLWVTVHPEDDESRRLWTGLIGVPSERVVNHPDNFWTMGDIGPCGPCSEVFHDHGPALAGGPPGSADEDGDRYVEIWNLVFPQFDRSPDGTLTPLKKPGVDTGMGLERVAAIRQGVHSNYATDIFVRLMKETARLLPDARQDETPLRVIADHIRSAAFLLCDGVIPSNEDRGYVLRRIIRRALRYGYQCGAREPFFHALVAPLCASLGPAYPEIVERQQQVEAALLREELRFSRTLDSGMQMLERALDELSGDELPGAVVFKLYDTYGFPPDLTADVARGRQVGVDMQGFERAMQGQRERARRHTRYETDADQRVSSEQAVEFTGYTSTRTDARVLGVFRGKGRELAAVEALEAEEEGIVLLDRTPFYAEAGGQVGDQGQVQAAQGVFGVGDTRKAGDQFLHAGRVLQGTLKVGDAVCAEIDVARRERIRHNHSATHLLHAALRQILGTHVRQRGSLVAEDRLRFDFSHDQQVTREELRDIEALVNRRIHENSEAHIRVTSFDEALDSGALALFGEKYGDQVRVLDMGEGFSVELCGGTHVARTGDIGLFKILSESAIAAGVRRIEAVSGAGAYAWVTRAENQLGDMRALLKAGGDDLVEKTVALVEERARLNKALDTLSTRLARELAERLASRAVQVGGLWVLAQNVSDESGEGTDLGPGLGPDLSPDLRKLLDLVRERLRPSLVVLAGIRDGRLRLVAGRSSDCTQLSAREALAVLGEVTGAKGGGRDDFAQSGGGDASVLASAFERLLAWVQAQLR